MSDQHLSQIRGMYIEKARLAAELLCTVAASGLQEVTQGEREELSRAASVLQRLQHKLREVQEPAPENAFAEAEQYDLERAKPASEEARAVWRRILDKPHYALPIIQELLDKAP